MRPAKWLVVHLMRRGQPSCTFFFFSSLFNTKLPLFPLDLPHAPSDFVSRPFEVRQTSSASSSAMVVQSRYELSAYLPRTICLCSSRSPPYELCQPFGSSSPHNIYPKFLFFHNGQNYNNSQVIYIYIFMCSFFICIPTKLKEKKRKKR